MGNLLSFASDAFSGWGDVVDEAKSAKNNNTDEKKQDIDRILMTESTDMWNLLQFIETQGEDASIIKKQIATLLQHHREMNYHFVSRKMESVLGIHESYIKMIAAIKTSLKTGLLSLPRVVNHNHSLNKTSFYLELDNLVAMVAATAGAASIGGIIVAVLSKLKKIDFFSEHCETTGHGDQSLSIIEVSRTNNDSNGIVLFEIARVNVQLKDKQGTVVWIGGKEVRVQLDAYYSRGTVALCDLFPDESERKKVIAALKEGESRMKTASTHKSRD